MAQASRRRVLFIDNDPNIREIVSSLLASFAYDCHTAPDGRTGLLRLAEGRWNLVVTDLTMPLVLLTGSSDPEVQRPAGELGLRITAKHAVSLREEARRERAERHRVTQATCPLCAHPATLTDWRPGLDWIAVEDCPCQGFFIWGPLLTARVPRLPASDRQDISDRLRAFRAGGDEAWLATADGTVTGLLVVRSQRPDRPLTSL
jgi:CheY-like chemotaxis protein